MNNFKFKRKGQEYWYSRSVAVLGIIEGFAADEKFVLANKRGKNTPDFQGYWNMPCGYVDFNETTEEAIQREVYEETGLTIPIKKFELLSVDSIPEGRQNITLRYKVEGLYLNAYSAIHNNNAENKEVDEVKWIPLDEIDNYQWAFNHKDLIKKYLLNSSAVELKSIELQNNFSVPCPETLSDRFEKTDLWYDEDTGKFGTNLGTLGKITSVDYDKNYLEYIDMTDFDMDEIEEDIDVFFSSYE